MSGCPDQPEDQISDDLRRRNLKDFRHFLEFNLLPMRQSATNRRLPIQIIEFDDEEWFDVDGNPGEDYPDLLASVIIDHFDKDEAGDGDPDIIDVSNSDSEDFDSESYSDSD